MMGKLLKKNTPGTGCIKRPEVPLHYFSCTSSIIQAQWNEATYSSQATGYYRVDSTN